MKKCDTDSPQWDISSIGLQSRFLLGLACIFICFCVVVTTLLYLYEKKRLENEIYYQTELIMAAVESTRAYVRDVLRPKMYETLGHETFILEAMSTSYISRVVMERFQETLPSFEYRRVAINAMNPDFEADALEREKIQYFTENPAMNDWHGIVKLKDQALYMRFRPVRFTTRCFRCHGDPADAPRTIIDLYGKEHGFNQKPDVVSGVISVGVPVNAGLMPIVEVAWKVFCATFIAVVFLYGIIWFFFNKLIIRDLRGLLEIFRDNLRDEHGVQLYEQARATDEFGELAASVQVVARHLRKTRLQLEDYAKNLEEKVKDRTRALQRSEQHLREKVITRGQELRTLNTISELITQSVYLADILPRVLQQALKVMPAAGAGMYLVDREKAMLVLQCREHADALVESIPFDASVCLPFLDEKRLDFDGFIQQAACGRYGTAGEKAVLVNNFNVPLCCRGQILGVMTFTGKNLKDVDAQLQELLFSIGHQIGITIESLQNIARLIDSKELLQTVFDGITDVVLLLDPEYRIHRHGWTRFHAEASTNHGNSPVRHHSIGDFRIKMVNKAFLDQQGLQLEEILNRSLSELPLKNPCPFTACKTAFSALSGPPIVEQVNGEDGNIYEVNFYPLFSDQGELRNIVCYAKDITEKIEVERRIQQTEKLVSLGQLAAGVAHEINNPLGIILCYTDILLEDNLDLDPQACEDVRVIEKHARSCQKIVTDLLNFSRSQKTDKCNGSVNRAIEEVVALAKQQFIKQKIHLTLHLDYELPDIFLDRDRIKQVFLNLLMNAAHAIREEGTVLIVTGYDQAAHRIVVTVEDDGQGIEDEVIAKIFDPFFTTKAPGSGTGLGLSVSYGIVQDHGGDICVESQPGQWTRFTITLPVNRAAQV
ncbi:MAG TPA: DUF3365 domain-containing protein [Desulfobulbus sp.]|nr:DUF3365 domain-containing protein [Desulfobulbus sp.]